MKLIGSIAFLFVGAAGCAEALPPQDLVTARASYTVASKGNAATYDPADLHWADDALKTAEAAFKENGDTQSTRDLAYIADRRAQIAETRGATIKAVKEQQQTVGVMHDAQTTQLAVTTGQLGQANTQLKLKDQALGVERERREESDKRAAKAASDLAAFASVKQETRGMVITLSGAVLFVSGKSDLMPGAQLKLNNVAEALTQQDAESKIMVEGHTDSQGGASYNQDLSQRRAQSVRDYLVTRGISSDRVKSQGFGLTRPIADNDNAEGRANNRRVEIVVLPASK